MIYIVDTGASNRVAVERWLNFNDIPTCELSNNIKPNDIALIPGVGSWDEVIKNLIANGQWDILLKHKNCGGKFIGICLGFQLLMAKSSEGVLPGLDLFNYELIKFSENHVKVPHVGFNEIVNNVKKELNECYFTHSYFLPLNNINDQNNSFGITNYGCDFISMIETKNCLASQFHPEKSSFGGDFFIDKIKKLSKC